MAGYKEQIAKGGKITEQKSSLKDRFETLAEAEVGDVKIELVRQKEKGKEKDKENTAEKGKEKDRSKEKAVEKPVIPPGNIDLRQAVKNPKMLEEDGREKKSRSGEKSLFEKQAEMDTDSIKSGNQIGAIANNRMGVKESLEDFATDGFDSEHNEAMEAIGAEMEDLDDLDAIRKGEDNLADLMDSEKSRDTGFESARPKKDDSILEVTGKDVGKEHDLAGPFQR